MEVFLAKAMVELLAGDEGGGNAAQASSAEAQDTARWSPPTSWRGLGQTWAWAQPSPPPQLLHQHLQGVERAGVREGAGAGEGPRAGTLSPRQEYVRAVEVPVHPRGWVHDLPAVKPGQQGDHGTVEEGVWFEPCGSGGSGGFWGLGGGNSDGMNCSGEGSASEAAGGGRGGEESAVGSVAAVLR